MGQKLSDLYWFKYSWKWLDYHTLAYSKHMLIEIDLIKFYKKYQYNSTDYIIKIVLNILKEKKCKSKCNFKKGQK